MSSNHMMIFRVAVEGYQTQEFRVFPRLIRHYIQDMKEAFDENGIKPDGSLIRMVTVSHSELRVGWRGFFQYIHCGIFTIPELVPAAAGKLAGNHFENLWRVAEEIFQAYDVATRFDLVDFQNKIMDALYDLGHLTNRYLGARAMEYILERLDPDSKMQSYCAATIALMLSKKEWVDVSRMGPYEALAADFQELKMEVSLREAGFALRKRHHPDLAPLVHMYWGPCKFHEHPDGEECYLENGSRPWGRMEDQATSDDEVDMVDRGIQTDNVVESHSNGNAARKDLQTHTEKKTNGDESYEADISCDDSEEGIPAVIKKKFKCSYNERR
ncbi:hypothetical protein BKA64DRAFT_636828 [Cadophora sp. MPI-SDFR-AT-0126]|nr:hypothetical protein BKA64DRAFT_636828 [Leotiomycetes sp. MPI-SDFR-AT-0126]